jgi:nucleotide-binding universal stress UspA family protein
VAGKVLHKLHLPVLVVRPFGFKETHSLLELLEAQDEPYAKTFLENGIRLLVPLDQTEKSEAALEPAFELAAALNAPVNLVAVNEPPANVFYGEAIALAVSPEEMQRREDMLRDSALSYLGQIAQSAHKKGVATERQTFIGDPYTEITKYVSQLEPDLIVMATHARGEVGRWIFGSVAGKLMQNTHLPVLLVPSTPHPAKQEAEAKATGIAAETTTF